MKSRHQRNTSLLQEKHRYHQQNHHRSFSYTRHQKQISHMHLNYISPQNFATQSAAYPFSTELPRQSNKVRTKKVEKQSSKQFKKDKEKRRSKEQDENSRKKRKEKVQVKSKKSGEKSDKAGKVWSKQLAKQKYSNERVKGQHSTQARHLKSNQFKKTINEKNTKTLQRQKQKKIKKKVNQQQTAQDCEDVIIQYGNYLTQSQITQIQQYKWIYFLGKITQRKFRMRPVQVQDVKTTRDHPQIEKQLPSGFISHRVWESSPPFKKEQSQKQDVFYKYQLGDHIAYRYQIIQSINQGSFGEVLKVFDHKTKEYLALKIAKRSQQLVQQTFMQISILTQIRERDKSNMSGVVRIKDFTIFRNHICMVFELLQGNLYELLSINHYNGLREDVVRIFAVQILNSLSFLQNQKIIHCDIKPQNIVMRTWGKSGIKLIDFGTSCFQGKQVYQYLQSRYYRAPQVIFKKQYSFPIDMWSFGCLIAQLKLGEPIFAGSNNIEQIVYIANSIGTPNQRDGPYSKHFLHSDEFQQIFAQNYIGQYRQMQEQEEYINNHHFFSKCKYIRTCMKTVKQRIEQSQQNLDHDNSFYNFLKKILVWEPAKRLTPQQALQDPWITKGLPNQMKQLYTMFNSVQYPKKAVKKKSKDSKGSNNKSNPKRGSKDKARSKEYSGEHRMKEIPFKQTSKFYSYNSKLYCNDSANY